MSHAKSRTQKSNIDPSVQGIVTAASTQEGSEDEQLPAKKPRPEGKCKIVASFEGGSGKNEFRSPSKGPLIQPLLSSYLVNPIFHESEVSTDVPMTISDPSDQGTDSAVSEIILAPSGDFGFGLSECEQNISSAIPSTGTCQSFTIS
ncbi:unnamed protein product [Allacma fusca]|uniref:Uncharacterized protein n=1 Tax=Allacma fusca TaxID=39272 RepID=A0A8J2JMG3_9HEXA|nr:unnamed protein product [Allacma fusca]